MDKILVLGAGKSGLAASLFLAKKGHPVVLSDTREPTSQEQKLCAANNIKVVIGAQEPSLLEQVARVVVSPGIAPSTPIVQEIKARKILLSTEIDLAVENFPGPWIGVTGTNGKSTTTVMIEHLLKKAGVKALAGGNLGRPACDLLQEKPDVLVLELSSYQMEYSLSLQPTVAVFTSFSADHLARHGSMENYFATKWRLIENARQARILSPEAADWAKTHSFEMSGCQTISALVEATLNLAKHDRLNAACAVAAAQVISPLDHKRYIDFFADFKGLDFRFQTIAHLLDQPIINDSKATNVDSTLVALASIEAPCILLLGGQGKGESFSPILLESKKIKRIIAFGQARQEISAAVGDRLPLLSYASLADALTAAGQWLDGSGPVLFSPACASFDEFDNFEHRGRFFNQAIKRIVPANKARKP